MEISIILFFVVLILAVISLFSYVIQLKAQIPSQRALLARATGISNIDGKKVVGFFHPYCNAGGGGERVLWTAIAFLQRTEPNIVSVVYTGDTDVTKEQILAKVKARFNIQLSPSSVHFVFLRSRYLVEESTWPRFTLLGQSLGSMYLAWEAMAEFIPDLFIDTMGYAFTFNLIKLLGRVNVGAYVHYPTISHEMLARVKSRQHGYTNSSMISSSAVLSQGKLLYYRFLMFYYAQSLRKSSFVMVNSSWTKAHIDSILTHSDQLIEFLHYLPPFMLFKSVGWMRTYGSAWIVYPPCDTREMTKFSLTNRQRVIVSVAQFRPEKDHKAQLMSFAALLSSHPEYRERPVKLVLIGGSRNAEDAARVAGLRSLAKELEIEKFVEFVVNAPYSTVLAWLKRASIGLSTMVDEHFGINIVEFMAAGVIPVAHASGGPLHDIIVPFNGEPTGYHATSPDTFAEAFHTIFTLPKAEDLALRQRARTWAVQRFSNEEFESGWNASEWKSWL